MSRASVIIALCFGLLISGHSDAGVRLRGGGYIAPVGTQTIASISLSNSTFAPGIAASVVGTLGATMSPASPPFSGSWSLSTSATNCTPSNGTNNSSFQISGNTLKTIGALASGTYAVCVAATQSGISNSPLGQPFTLTAQAFASAQLSCDPSCAFTAGTAGTIGNASATLTPASPAFSGTWSLQFSGTDHAGTTCDTHSSYFSISGNTVSATSSAVAGTYHVCTVATLAGIGGSPFVQAETITGITSGGPTMFVAGRDCNANLTLTNGGLTVTGPSTTPAFFGYPCRASKAKYSGLQYYEVTLVTNNTTYPIAFGFANNGTAQPWSGGWDPNASSPNFFAADANETGYATSWSGGGPALGLKNTAIGTASGWTAGKTAGVALNLNTDSPQIWVTTDVANLVCNGSGGAGTTAPMWNGSCAHDPSLPGSGTPVTGNTGAQTFLPGWGYFPAMQIAGPQTSSGLTTSLTFNFGASSFLGTVPSGYSAWNAAGGGVPTPGPNTAALPSNGQTMNVANAPGWQASTSYAAGSRVVAGPALVTGGNPGTYTSGSALYLWAANATGGPYTSGSSRPAGFGSCANPANTGGGFTGSTPAGWAGATTVADNGITWTCLTAVDYVTMTGAMADDKLWQASTKYYPYQIVTWTDGNAYQVPQSAPSPCTSYSGSGGPPADTGGCGWGLYASLVYSSKVNILPHQIHYGGAAGPKERQGNYDTNVIIWYGGVAKQKYEVAVAGESNPMRLWWHQSQVGDATVYAYQNYGVEAFNSGLGVAAPNVIPYSVAPGDAWQNNASHASTPLAVNPALGVTWYNAQTTGNTDDPASAGDYNSYFTNLQIKSVNGGAFTECCSAPYRGGALRISGDIIDAGGGFCAVYIDSYNVLHDDAIIYRGTATGGCAYADSYATTAFYNNTIVGPGASACPTCIAIYIDKTNVAGATEAPVNNTVVMGFAHMWACSTAHAGTDCGTVGSSNNATDLGTTDSGTGTPPSPFNTGGATATYFNPPGVGSTCTPPGNSSSCANLTAASNFVNPLLSTGPDLRIVNSSANIYGGGSSATGGAGYVVGPDIYGTPRPQSGRYDIGAMQCPSASCP
jgi:hypothetical protein